MANEISPATMIAELNIIFGATATGTTNRQTITTACAKQAAIFVWRYSRWDFRHTVLNLVTVASQAYTALPADYRYEAMASDWLVENASEYDRPTFIPPAKWENECRRYGTSGTPQIYTVGHETIDTVVTPVVRWRPTPAAVQTFRGFQYFRDMPTWNAASTSDLFPDAAFDVLWSEAANYFCSRRLPMVENVQAPSYGALRAMMDDAVAQYQYMGVPHAAIDVMRDADDQTVLLNSDSDVALYDSNGRPLA